MTLPILEETTTTTHSELILVRIIIDKLTGAWYETIRSLPADGDYLCRRGQSVWTSYIGVCRKPDKFMPTNCPEGCMYVRPKWDEPPIPLDQLDEIYYITQEGSQE